MAKNTGANCRPSAACCCTVAVHPFGMLRIASSVVRRQHRPVVTTCPHPSRWSCKLGTISPVELTRYSGGTATAIRATPRSVFDKRFGNHRRLLILVGIGCVCWWPADPAPTGVHNAREPVIRHEHLIRACFREGKAVAAISALRLRRFDHAAGRTSQAIRRSSWLHCLQMANWAR